MKVEDALKKFNKIVRLSEDKPIIPAKLIEGILCYSAGNSVPLIDILADDWIGDVRDIKEPKCKACELIEDNIPYTDAVIYLLNQHHTKKCNKYDGEL